MGAGRVVCHPNQLPRTSSRSPLGTAKLFPTRRNRPQQDDSGSASRPPRTRRRGSSVKRIKQLRPHRSAGSADPARIWLACARAANATSRKCNRARVPDRRSSCRGPRDRCCGASDEIPARRAATAEPRIKADVGVDQHRLPSVYQHVDADRDVGEAEPDPPMWNVRSAAQELRSGDRRLFVCAGTLKESGCDEPVVRRSFRPGSRFGRRARHMFDQRPRCCLRTSHDIALDRRHRLGRFACPLAVGMGARFGNASARAATACRESAA